MSLSPRRKASAASQLTLAVTSPRKSREQKLNDFLEGSSIKLKTDRSSLSPRKVLPQVVITTQTSRYDVFGTRIQKNSKQHCVSFRKKIHETILVQNWKQFNQDNYRQQSECCTLF